MKDNEESLYDELNKSETGFTHVETTETENQKLSIESQNATRYDALEKGRMLMEHDYNVDGKKTTGKKAPSKEMSAIFTELEALNVFLEDAGFQQEDEEALKADGEALLDRMRHLMQKCDDYLAKKSPWTLEGVARYHLVDNIGERLSHDIIGFEAKLKGYLQLPKEEKDSIKSWADFLNYERTMNFEDKKDGVKISKDGGNTSEVILIEKDGEKMYFKQEAGLPADNLDFVADEKKREISESIHGEILIGSKDFYRRVFIDSFIKELCGKPGITNAVSRAFFDVPASSDHFSDLMEFCDTFRMSTHGSLNLLLEKIDMIEDEGLKKETKAAIGDIFNDIKSTIVKAQIGKETALIKSGDDLVKRNVATYRLAKILKMEEVVPKSEMASIAVDNKKMYGVVMSDAGGMKAVDVYTHGFNKEHEHEDVEYAPEAIRDLLDLQILDAICGQTDRHANNRMMELEQKDDHGTKVNVVKKAVGIDGDFSFGGITYSEFKSKRYSEIRRVEGQNGLNMPALSLETAHAIMELSPEILDYEMTGLLTKDERAALKDRFMGVQQAIRKQMEYEKNHTDIPSKFIAADKWGDFHESFRNSIQGDEKKLRKVVQETYLDPSLVVGIKIAKKKA